MKETHKREDWINAVYYSGNWYPVVIKKEQDMKIDMNKKYRKVGTHESVRIICTDRVTRGDTFPFLGLRKDANGIEAVEYFDQEGRDPCGNLSIEEVPQTDWNKVKVDTLIWVSNCPRYFAGYEDGDVLFYSMGTTSLTYKAMNAEILTASRNVTVSLEKPFA